MWLSSAVTSLFSNASNGSLLRELDGIRAYYTIHIVLVHTFFVCTMWMDLHNYGELLKYTQSHLWIFLGGYGVDVFFVIAGMLLSREYIVLEQQQQQQQQHKRNSMFGTTMKHVVMRLLRLLPVFWINLLYRSWSNPKACLSKLHWYLAGIHNLNEDSLHCYSESWSVGVDLQMSLLLPLMLLAIQYLCKKMNQSKHIVTWYRTVLFALMLVGLLIRVYGMYNIANTDGYEMKFPVLPSVYASINPKHLDYIPLPISPIDETERSIVEKFHPRSRIMMAIYNETYYRFAPFIAGAFITLQLKIDHQKKKNSLSIRSLLYLFLAIGGITLQASYSWFTASSEYYTFNVIYFAANHYLFAFCFAYLLYRIISVQQQDVDIVSGVLKCVKKLLSLSVWIPLSRLSYLIYACQFPVIFAVVNQLNPSVQPLYPSALMWNVFLLTLVVLIGLSTVLYVLVEYPIQYLIREKVRKWLYSSSEVDQLLLSNKKSD
jgi:peptidoglycan/LPS O-acetylase OafA/YrhL